MTDETKIWKQIEDYFSGEMDEKEMAAFEKAISVDSDLADRVEAYRLTENVVVVHEALKLKAQMNNDLKDSKSKYGRFWLFAVLGLGIGLGGYFLNTSSPDSPKEEMVSKPKIEPASERIAAENATKKVEEKQFKKQEKNISQDLRPKSEIEEAPTLQANKYADQNGESKLNVVIPTKEDEIGSEVPQAQDLCQGLKIDLDFYVLPSCKNQSTGEVHVRPKTIKGGIAPYSFAIYPNKDFHPSFIKEMQAGGYQLNVKDGNGCVVTIPKSVVVPSVNCQDALKEFTYSPMHDAAWTIPYDANKTAKNIKILNKVGLDIFRSEVISGNPSEWNGESNTGMLIETGYYLYFIEYTDGTLDKGAISILR